MTKRKKPKGRVPTRSDLLYTIVSLVDTLVTRKVKCRMGKTFWPHSRCTCEQHADFYDALLAIERSRK